MLCPDGSTYRPRRSLTARIFCTASKSPSLMAWRIPSKSALTLSLFCWRRWFANNRTGRGDVRLFFAGSPQHAYNQWTPPAPRASFAVVEISIRRPRILVTKIIVGFRGGGLLLSGCGAQGGLLFSFPVCFQCPWNLEKHTKQHRLVNGVVGKSTIQVCLQVSTPLSIVTSSNRRNSPQAHPLMGTWGASIRESACGVHR